MRFHNCGLPYHAAQNRSTVAPTSDRQYTRARALARSLTAIIQLTSSLYDIVDGLHCGCGSKSVLRLYSAIVVNLDNSVHTDTDRERKRPSTRDKETEYATKRVVGLAGVHAAAILPQSSSSRSSRKNNNRLSVVKGNPRALSLACRVSAGFYTCVDGVIWCVRRACALEYLVGTLYMCFLELLCT